MVVGLVQGTRKYSGNLCCKSRVFSLLNSILWYSSSIILDFLKGSPWSILLLSLSSSSLHCNPFSVHFVVLLLISSSTTSNFHKFGIWFFDTSSLSTSVAVWSPSWQSLIDIPWTNCTKLSSLVLLYVAVKWDSTSLLSTGMNENLFQFAING